MGKLVTIATKARFDALREASNISETSLNFILETGLLYTHNIFINGASFGTATSNYIPVKIGGVTKNLSLNGHTHSNYYDNSSDIDIGSNKIKSGTLELLKYSSDTLILGNSSIPTEFFGTLKTTKDGTKYTILDTNNFSIVNKTSTNLTLNNVALFKYGSSSFQLDYVRRYNTVETFNNLAKYTSAGTTNENSKAYGFITLSTDTGTNTYSYAQIRVSIPDNTLEFRTSSDTTWKGTLLGGVYRNITINGTTYSIVTKAGSLPTIIAPTALGTSGQYLTTSDDGNSLTWRTLPTDNNTWRPIAVNGTEKRSSSTGSGNLDIINGTNTTVEWTSGNKLKINAVDTWTAFAGASDSVAGTAGYVSAPGKGNQGKFFRGDGTWATPTNTWNAANTSQAGYVPQLTTGGGTISTQASEYVLTYVSSGSGTVTPTWKLLPANAFKNDNTWKAANSSQEGYVPKSTANKILRSDANGALYWGDDSNTWKEVTTSLEGYVPKIVTTGSLAATDSPFILVFKNVSGSTKTAWVPLPANAFKNDNTWIPWAGATASANGTAGYMPAPTSALRGQFLRGDGSWVSLNNYSLPTASSSTLGGVKTGAAITDTTGYTAVVIKDGVIYYKDTNTWNANAVGVAGYVAAPTKAANANMTWLTDADGNPAWRASNNHSHSYLPLSGGTLLSTDFYPLTLIGGAAGAGMLFTLTGSNAKLGIVLFNPAADAWGMAMLNYSISKAIGIANDGTPYYGWNGSKNTLLHSGNYTSYKHAYTNLTGSGTTANQAIVSTGTANGWTLKTLGSNAFNSTDYLPLSGGTLTGSNNVLTLSNTSGGAIGLLFKRGSNTAWQIVDNGGNLYFTENSTNTTVLLLKESSQGAEGYIKGNLIYHAGNLPAYPTKSSWNYDDRYVSSLTTSGNSLRWVKNGSNNDITIPYATNADTVDSLHASNLVRFFLSPMTSGAPADSAKSWFTGTMPSASGAIIYNVPGSEKTIIAGKSSGSYGHMLQLSYDDTYLRILRYQGGSWKSTDWEKISAGYADSAGAVTWSNVSSKPETATRWPKWTEVTDKPSSFTPSAHTHSYIEAKGNYTFDSSTLPNSFDFGVSAGFVNSNSGFGSYGSVLTVRTYSGGGGTLQLYAPYSSTYGGTHMKARFGNYASSSGNSWTDLKEVAWVSDIPTKVSQLTNDSGYITGVSWANVSSKPATATRWPTWDEVTSKPSSFAPSAHDHERILPTRHDNNAPSPKDKGASLTLQFSYKVIGTDWWNVLNIRSYSDYNYMSAQILTPAGNPGSDTGYGDMYWRLGRQSTWITARKILDDLNSSVSKSGETLTVKIGGTSLSLTNTWRGILDNLTSSTNTTESLSAKQGYLLANGSARDSTKLPLSGGTSYPMTGTLYVGTSLGISDASGNGLLCYHPGTWTGVTSSQWGLGTIDSQGVIRSNASNLVHYKGDTAYNILDSSNSSVSLDGSTLTVKINGTSKSLTNTNTTYTANNGVSLSGTTFYNSGVRATTINGNYLRVNTNGSNADLTIPYATSASSANGLNIDSSSFTTGAVGWYRLAMIATTDPRGSVRIGLMTVGGNFTPFYAELYVKNGWANTDFILYGRLDYITKFRLTKDSTNTYIEGYFPTASTAITLQKIKSRGYVNDNNTGWTIYKSATAGGGTIDGNEFAKSSSTSVFSCSGYLEAKEFVKSGSSDSYVLLGGGGQAAISDLSVSYASSSGSVAWNNVTGKPSTFSPSSHSHGLTNSSFFATMPAQNSNKTWKYNFGYNMYSDLLMSVRISSPAPEWCVGDYGSGILYGGADTKGFMSSSYGTPKVMWAGGNGTGDDAVPKWYFGITGTNGTIYNLSSMPYAAKATNDSDGNAINSTYLKKSGGTMTGTLNIGTSLGISDASGNGMLCYHPGTWTGVSSSQWGLGSIDSQGVIRSSNSDLVHYRHGNNSFVILDSSNYSSYALPKSGGTMSGGITFSQNAGGTISADSAGIYIQTGSHWLRATSSECQYDGYTILNANNYSSYAFPKTGGTITGNVTIKGTANADTALSLAGSQYTMDFLIGSGNVNRGIYNRTGSAWMFYFDASNTIMNYGNVGIGTTSPANKLHVAGSTRIATNTYRMLELRRTDGYGSGIGFYKGDTILGDLGYDGDGNFLIRRSTSATNSLVINTSGNVGIGASPSYKLHVNGNGYYSGSLTINGNTIPSSDNAYNLGSTSIYWQNVYHYNSCVWNHVNIGYQKGQFTANRAELTIISRTDVPADIYFGSSNTYKWQLSSRASGESYKLNFYCSPSSNSSFTALTLDQSGNVYATNFYTTSDRSKKQNISEFSEHIRKFQLKDTEKWHYGVIAQEVEEMFRDGEEGNMTVNYNSVLSYYVGLLENKVASLEKELNILKQKLK